MYSKVIQLYIYMHILFHIIFHNDLLQDIEYSSPCYAVGPCCLFIYFLKISISLVVPGLSCVIRDLLLSAQTLIVAHGLRSTWAQ